MAAGFKLAQPGQNLRDRISSLRSHGLAGVEGGCGADKDGHHKHTAGPSVTSKLAPIEAITSTVKVPATQADSCKVIITEALTAEAVTIGLIAAETEKDSAVTHEGAKVDYTKVEAAKDRNEQSEKGIDYDAVNRKLS